MAEKTNEPIRLSSAAIVDGKYFPPGAALPYTAESEVPPNLRPLIGTGAEEPPFDPAERNIYDLPPHLRRQVRGIQSGWDLQDWAEEHASEPLPPETAEALQAKHDEHIAMLKAQGGV
jgi:hypothetical protein